ncbi:MAG: hypothetical protein ACJ8I9_02630 [Chthoniobacterales bacterium]
MARITARRHYPPWLDASGELLSGSKENESRLLIFLGGDLQARHIVDPPNSAPNMLLSTCSPTFHMLFASLLTSIHIHSQP